MRNNIYTSGEYIRNHPTLDVEDTPWKLTKIIPLIAEFARDSSPKEVALLDVGGGAGLILKESSDHLRKMNITVRKYAFDLSQEMLRVQRENNPDLVALINGDISDASIQSKALDLVLMIDVLEHVPDAVRTLRELRRISRYVIFKVPLERNFFYNTLNFFNRGRLKTHVQKLGHLNSYNFKLLKEQITRYTGKVLCYSFTNVFEFYLSGDYRRRVPLWERVLFKFGNMAFELSPDLCARIFNDFVVCLVKCDQE
jgi:ubiquinone/menaquinone biosynthesis C-methylase UbiE